jgi:uncharacterized protein
MKRFVTFAALIGLTINAPLQAQASTAKKAAGPSFKCANARTMAERVICGSPAFSAQDRAIASLYPRVVAATPAARRQALARDQRAFNRSREDCFTAEQDQDDCLAGVLESRIWQLNGWLRGGYR